MLTIKNILQVRQYQLLLLILLAFTLNVNTLFNDYVLDDSCVITNNTFVKKGISGIPEILSSELFAGFKNDKPNQLTEARYRPIALISFAIEFQFFGANPFYSHLINILLFCLLIYLLYIFLHDSLFKEQNPFLAFITCLLFVAHPIHTEVIANVKSRDELIAFIFLISSLILFIKHILKNRNSTIIGASICFFIALLTRESALTFILVFPLVMFFFYRHSFKNLLFYTLPFIGVVIIYLCLRFYVVGISHEAGKEILNNPFLYASPLQAFATKIYVILKYINLLIFPHPLSWDYGYNQLPYINITDGLFFVSVIVVLTLITSAIYSIKKNPIISFSIIYFFATLSIASNFLVDVGTPLSERFLFQPSLGFCIIIAYLFLQVNSKYMLFASSMLSIVLILFSIKTITRNMAWKNFEVLNLTDVKSSPNSVRTNQYALQIYVLKGQSATDPKLKLDYFKKAIAHGEIAIQLYHSDAITSMQMGVANFESGDYFKAADYWLETYKLAPYDQKAVGNIVYLSDFLCEEGKNYLHSGDTDTAIKYYIKATDLNGNNLNAWYNLGGCFYKLNDTINANFAWSNVRRISPDYKLDRTDFN